MYDLMVVGGGLAGSSTAVSALETNPDLEVAILERGERPASVCAGGIAKPMIERAGIRRPPIQQKIKTARIHSSSETVELSSRNLGVPYLGLVIDRARLDWNLLTRAEKLGADVHLGVGGGGVGRTKHAWFVRTARAFYEGRHLACADGALSETAQLAGVDTSVSLDDIHLGFQRVIKRRSKALEVWFDRSYVKTGYAWLFPAGRVTKVGIGASFAERVKLERVLDRFMGDKGITGDTVSTEAAPIPTAPPMRKLVHGDLALAGDAGRLACAATGGGIFSAAISGRLLGRAIGEGDIHRYERDIEPLRRDLRRRYFVKRLLYSLVDRDLDRVMGALRKFRPRSLSFGREIGRAVLYVCIRRPRLIAKVLGKKLEERGGWSKNV